MIEIFYLQMLVFISILWVLVRVICAVKNKGMNFKRELQLILVYICIIVVVRFTFCPFFKVDGRIQPLVFERTKAFPFRINWIPIVNLLDYPTKRDILLNIIGNTTMFILLGVVWPVVFKELNAHTKVIAVGIGVSLFIEILQLPFYERVSDVDDLILNSFGFVVGYLLYLLARSAKKKQSNK